ncbi:hypothetical protein SLNSH_21305 [Alsobacter soli]|uniref:DUF1761 domain-containing protein n=1 Tax=Alsobacter soli TaxID=2109933 RepID=A0A2T1HMX9_9HYPH|nr:hypothetical protein [Alsobacter soli]PSC02929.1 hypothetical protein SLNSH_21305 [Alsobacter soli]
MGWRVLFGFVAGFLSVLLVHQTALYVGGRVGFGGGGAWSMAPVSHWRIPSVIVTAALGGLWGVLLVHILPNLGRGLWGAVSAVLIFAVLISLTNWLVLAPLLRHGSGFAASTAIYPLVYNGVWAAGALALLRLTPRAGG